MRAILLFFLVTVLFFFSGCGNQGDPSPADNSKDRKEILTHWADNIIVPSYQQFKAKLDLMVTASEAFTTAPTETSLNEFRSAWLDAYTGWQKVELFEFGPADKYTLRNFFNIYPADATGINAMMQDPAASLEFPGTYARQGFPALDYLLNGLAGDNAAILAHYTTDGDAAKRLAYVTRIVTRMSSLLNQVISEWTGTYRDTFISKTGVDVGSSTSIAVNAYVLEYERYVRSGKIGIPSGATISTGGTPHPEKVEAYYKKDISVALAKTAHQAARDFFNGVNVNTGSEGPSFKSYLDGLGSKDEVSGAKLSDVIDDQFGIIGEKLNTLSSNLFDQIQTANQPVIDTHSEMQKLVRMLKVDMTSAMSITITYTDNDGD